MSKARGEFIAFLGDDDANSIATLELVKESLNEQPDCRLLGWQICQYYWEDHNDPEVRISKNNLVYAPFSGQLLKKDAKRNIKDIFTSHGLSSDPHNKSRHHEFPAIVNVFYHHSLISNANAAKHFFHPNCSTGDRYNSIISLNLVKDFFYLDYPLHLHGTWENSATGTVDSSRIYFQNSSEEMLTGLKCLTYRNYTANSLLQAKADIGESLDYIEIDWLRFFVENYNDLRSLKRRDFQVDDDLQDFYDVLAKQPDEFQEKFRSHLPSIPRDTFDS